VTAFAGSRKNKAGDRTMNEERSKKDQATFAALFGLLFFCGLLFLLIAAVLPDVLWLVAVVFGFGLFLVLQYLVWGRWLTSYLQKKLPDDSKAEREHLKKYGPHE
jgi:Flp pilus assembly protein TadB